MGKEHIGEASGDIYTYKHRSDNGVDIHEIFVKKSRARVLLSYAGVIFLLAIVCQSLLRKESLCLGSVWSITFGVLIAKCLQYKPVMKESVVIMPSFGVQVEIHFWSGTVDRCFIPIGKILKPLLNECVTPVTCYWSLALLLRDEEELKLVFQKFRPPVKMLVLSGKLFVHSRILNVQAGLLQSLNQTGQKRDLFGVVVWFKRSEKHLQLSLEAKFS